MVAPEPLRESRAVRLSLLTLFILALAASPAAADSIVFIKDANVWVAAPDGSAARPLTSDGTPQLPYTSPSQSDAGVTVAVRGTRLYRIDRHGGKTALNSLLTDKPGSIGAVGPNDARISPDGAKIAYWIGIMGGWYDYATGTYYTDPQAAIAIQSAADGTPLGSTMFFEEPSWTPDGRLLLWDSLNGGVPQAYYGPAGTNHNQLTPWFHDRDVFSVGQTLWNPIGAGELKGSRLALLRAGGTMGAGYAARGRFNTIEIANAGDLSKPPVAECRLADDQGTEFGPPSWSPNADGLAWATPAGIYTTPLGRSCAGFVERLVVPGGREPDWGPADPGLAAAAPPATAPAPPAKPGPPKPPAVTIKARGRRITVRCACAIKVVARKGGRIVARGRGSGKVTLKVRARGKVKVTVTAGDQRVVRTVRIR